MYIYIEIKMAAKTNQFSALNVKNVETRHVEEEMEFEKAIVQAAVNTEATKKFETRSNTKSAKAKNTTTTHEGAITGELVTLVITAIQPVLVKAMTAAVTTAVATASKQIMLELRHDLQTVVSGVCAKRDGNTADTGTVPKLRT